VRKARAREAERRRQAVTTLRLAQALAGYAADQVADGLSAEQARAAVLDASAELADAAASLRRLARLRPGERRTMAALLAGRGLPTKVIAAQLGVSDRSVRNYVNGRSPARSRRRRPQVDAADPAPGTERTFR